eukprot:XP_001700787.1 predicted protein [Chlamydomonas reinhardtii]
MAISSARLACKALRELLDGSIEGVRLRMRKDELIEVTHGSPGASFADLARWPRASSVTLALEDGTDQGTDELCEPGCCAADVAMLWLSRQSSAARHTILDVELEYAPMLEHPWQVAALSTLPLWLPNLKSLDLRGLQGWWVPPESAAGLVTLFRGLAGLPHLQHLSLPHAELLQYAHHLLPAPAPARAASSGPGHGAGTGHGIGGATGGTAASGSSLNTATATSTSPQTPPLRDLYVETLFPIEGDLPPQVLPGVAALTCLNRLTLAHLTPPSWSLHCVARDPGIPLGTLGRLARDVLLPCRRLWEPSRLGATTHSSSNNNNRNGGGGEGGGWGLRALELPLVTDAEALVAAGSDAESRLPEEAAQELAAVRELVRRPQLRVALGTLVLGPTSTTPSARAVLDALGGRPRELRLLLDRRRCFPRLSPEADGYVTVQVPSRSGSRALKGAGDVAAAGNSFAEHAAAAAAEAVVAMVEGVGPCVSGSPPLHPTAVVSAALDFLTRAAQPLPFWEAAAAEEPDEAPAADAACIGPDTLAPVQPSAAVAEAADAEGPETELACVLTVTETEPTSVACTGASTACGDAAADGLRGAEPEPEPAAPDLLLVRGPLVSTMIRAPVMFQNWLDWLAPAADAAATAASRWNGLHRIPGSPVGVFKLLPGSHPLLGAVLVRVASAVWPRTGTRPRTGDTAGGDARGAGTAASSAATTATDSAAVAGTAAVRGGSAAEAAVVDSAGEAGLRGDSERVTEEDGECEGGECAGPAAGGSGSEWLAPQLEWCVALQAELQRLPLAVELAVT